MDRVLDIFYNQILKEAASGRVDCGMMYNVLFKTKINNKTLYNLDSNITKINSLFIPTLIINDLDKFNFTLYKYYEKAKNFYRGKISGDNDFDKTILTLVWNNMSEDDFKNPVNYLNRYIDFLDKPFNIDIDEYKNIGYSSILDSDILVCLKEEPINEETPYGLYIRSVRNNLYYDFPVVRFGISNNKAYIYAVQQCKNKELDDSDILKYQKSIHRCLFKVNDGFIKEEESDNILNPENLTGISPSALVSLTIILSIFSNMNIKEVEVPTFLPVRYNAKEISYIIRKRVLENKGYDVETINNLIHDYENEHLEIQRNLSDKLLRYFRRLEYNFNNINIEALPFDVDNNTHLLLNDDVFCNNPLLDEIFNITYNKNVNNIKL